MAANMREVKSKERVNLDQIACTIRNLSLIAKVEIALIEVIS